MPRSPFGGSSSPFGGGSSPFAGGYNHPHGVNDNPELDKLEMLARDKREYNSLAFKAQQAHASGLFTEQEYQDAKTKDKASYLQKLMGFVGPDAHNSGGMLESAGDLLNVGNIFTASMTQATLDDPAGEISVGRILNPAMNSASIVGAALGGFTSKASELADEHGNGYTAALAVSGGTAAIPDLVKEVAAGVQGAYDQYEEGYKDYGPQTLRVGFGTDAFTRAWSNKTDFTKLTRDKGVFGGSEGWQLAGGLATDLLMDPTNYLTFGMKQGAKVALTDMARQSSRSGRVAALVEGHLTHFGTELYNLALRKKLPSLQAEGKAVSTLTEAEGKRWHGEVANYMVENFDTLKQEYMANNRIRKWWTEGADKVSAIGRLGERIGLTEKKVNQYISGMNVDDVFQESARFTTMDLGIRTDNLQRRLASFPGAGKYASKLFDTFDRGWDAPAEVVEQLRLSSVAEQAKIDAWKHEYNDAFKDLSDDELNKISHEVENRHQSRVANDAGITPEYSPRQEKAITYFQDQMDAILEEERAAGYHVDRVEGYVGHIANPVERTYLNEIIRKNGTVLERNDNKYLHQRMIASLADAAEVFGEGSFETNALKILVNRRRASVSMIEKGKMYDFILENYGKPTALVHAVSRGMSKAVLRGYARAAGRGVAEVLPVDQVYKATHGNLTKLGFREEDPAYNRALLEFLMRPNDDKAAVAAGTDGAREAGKYHPSAGAERFNEEAQMFYVTKGDEAHPLPQEFHYREEPLSAFDVRPGPTAGGQVAVDRSVGHTGFDVKLAHDMLHDTKHPAWKALFATGLDQSVEKFDKVFGFLDGLNRYTVDHLDSQLTGMFPNLDEKIIEAWQLTHLEGTAPLRAKTPRGQLKLTTDFVGKQQKLQQQLAHVLASFSGPLEVRKVEPQIPPELVSMAEATRRMAGYALHDLPPTSAELHKLRNYHAKLGLTPSLIKQLNMGVFGSDEIKTAHELHLVLDTLHPYVWDDLRPADFIMNPRTGVPVSGFENWEKVSLTLPRRKTGGHLPSEHNFDEAIPAGEAGLEPTLAQRANGSPLQGPAAKESSEAVREGAVRQVQLDTGNVPQQELRVVDRAEESRLATRKPGENDSAQDKLFNMSAKNVETAQEAYKAIRGKAAAVHPTGPGAIRSKIKVAAEELKHAKALLPAAKKAYYDAKKLAKTPAAKVALAPLQQEYLAAKSAVVDAAKRHTDGMKEWAAFKPKEAEYKKAVKETKAAAEKMQEAIKRHKSVQQEFAAARAEAAVPTPDHGGIDVQDSKIKQQVTPADRIRELRQKLNDPRYDKAAIQQQLDDALLQQGRVAEGSAVQLPEGGTERAAYTATDVEVYLPKEIAKLLKDFDQPDLPRSFGKEVRKAIKVWDAVTGLYRVGLMTPHAGFYSRNAIFNTAIVTMEHGFRMLSKPQDFVSIMGYGMGTFSDYWKHLGQSRGAEKDLMRMMGDHIIKSDLTGEEMTVRELVDFARRTGIMGGLMNSEHLNDLGGWGRYRAAWTGGNAGAMYGQMAAAAVGLPPEVASYASAMTGVVGTILGGVHQKTLRGIPILGKFGAVTGLLQSQWRPVIRLGEAVTETPFKLAMLVGEFKKTGSLRQANLNVMKYMNDYHGLSVFERRLMRRIVPFYGWTKHALALTGRQLLEEPEKLANVHKLFRDWNYVQEADPEDVPDFVHNKWTMVVRNAQDMTQLEADNHRDNPRFGKESYDVFAPGVTPWEDAAGMVEALTPTRGQTWGEETQDFMQSIVSRASFQGVAMAELMFQKDIFTGKELEKAASNPQNWKNAPDYLKYLAGYQEGRRGKNGVETEDAVLNPRMAWLLGKIPSSRFNRVVQRVYDSEGEVDTNILARQLLGVGAYKVDPKTQVHYINRGRIDKLAQFLDHVKAESLKKKKRGATR